MNYSVPLFEYAMAGFGDTSSSPANLEGWMAANYEEYASDDEHDTGWKWHFPPRRDTTKSSSPSFRQGFWNWWDDGASFVRTYGAGPDCCFHYLCFEVDCLCCCGMVDQSCTCGDSCIMCCSDGICMP